MKSSLELFINSLKKLIVILEKNLQSNKIEGNTSIHTLAPKILTDEKDLKNIEPYLKCLKEAINTKGINNIALAGSYGSGKSTILKTFQNQNPGYKYLNISLASFTDNKESFEVPDLERKLEISILQQMFYHVKPSVIPDSRFKRIINLTTQTLLIHTAYLIIWALSTLFLFKFNKIDKLNPDGWYSNYQIDWFALFSAIIFLVGLGFFVKSIFRLFSNSKINKINIKGEFELGETIDKSVFNQHLEEILYFFERTEFSVVVIEDVDRFNSTEIFTKLREINILINNSNSIDRSIKFIYAIRDEMFIDKNERVKFFEFIIPVIPFISPSNASDQLEKLIRGADLVDVLSSDFTSDVVTFIDDIDMRLLINIFHEFLIYRESLSSDLTQENLFAIIVYKNMFPSDFGNLGKRKGNLYKFLTSRSLYIKVLINEIDSRIKEIDDKISLLEGENEKPIEELRAVYINRLVPEFENFQNFYINYRRVSVVDALNEENFGVIKNSDNIEYYRWDQNNSRKSNIRFSAIEKKVSNLTYDQREKLLLERSNNQINNLKVEKEKLRSRKAEIDSLSIKEIFELVNIESYLGEFKENYLMRNLLLNGYIDEHYDDYISLFHEVSLTKEDFAFERRVKSGFNSDFNYSITKTENLLKRLQDKYFKRETILNYNLIECLLKNRTKYKIKFDNFFKGISNDGERQFQFINGFIKLNSNETSNFIKYLCISKPTLWQYLYNKSGLPEEEIRKYLMLIFEFADKDSIIKFNEVDSLVGFLERMDDFLSFSLELKNTNCILDFINEKKLLFEKLDLPRDSRKGLFEFIYLNNLYRINEHNILIFIKFFEKPIDLEALQTAHYSTLLTLGLEQLLQNISNNLGYYIKNTMLMIDGNTGEHESTIINILNRKDLDFELKSELLAKQITKIDSIDNIIDNDVRHALLVNNKLKPTWDNVFNYLDSLEGKEFDEPIISFLNSEENYFPLSKSKLEYNKAKDEEYIRTFSTKIVYSENLNIEAFSALIKSIPFSFEKLNYAQLSSSKAEAMLFEQMLTLSFENFDGLKEKGNNLQIKLIENYQEQFVENYSELPLDVDDWVLFFKDSFINLSHKLAVIGVIDDSLIISNPQIADAVCEIIPTNDYVPLRYEVLDAMFKANSSNKKRLILLNLHFDQLDDGEIQTLTELLGEDYKKIFMKQHKPVFLNNSLHATFFDKLKKRDLIIRFEPITKTNELKVIAKY